MQANNLEELITEGSVEEIRTYLNAHPHAVFQNTSFGVSPIMLSCYYHKPDITQLLLEYKTEPDFFEACSAGKFDIVAHHIYQNPEIIHLFSDDGYTALGLACYFGKEEIAQYLILKGAEVNLPSNNNFRVFPIHSATAGNFLNITRMLLNHQANSNVTQQMGMTPLHMAAQNGNIDMIILLLENAANVDLRMEGGKLPADLAREKGFEEIAEILA